MLLPELKITFKTSFYFIIKITLKQFFWLHLSLTYLTTSTSISPYGFFFSMQFIHLCASSSLCSSYIYVARIFTMILVIFFLFYLFGKNKLFSSRCERMYVIGSTIWKFSNLLWWSQTPRWHYMWNSQIYKLHQIKNHIEILNFQFWHRNY